MKWSVPANERGARSTVAEHVAFQPPRRNGDDPRQAEIGIDGTAVRW